MSTKFDEKTVTALELNATQQGYVVAECDECEGAGCATCGGTGRMAVKGDDSLNLTKLKGAEVLIGSSAQGSGSLDPPRRRGRKANNAPPDPPRRRRASKYLILRIGKAADATAPAPEGQAFDQIGPAFTTMKGGWAYVADKKVAGDLMVVCIRQRRKTSVQETLVFEKA